MSINQFKESRLFCSSVGKACTKCGAKRMQLCQKLTPMPQRKMRINGKLRGSSVIMLENEL